MIIGNSTSIINSTTNTTNINSGGATFNSSHTETTICGAYIHTCSIDFDDGLTHHTRISPCTVSTTTVSATIVRAITVSASSTVSAATVSATTVSATTVSASTVSAATVSATTVSATTIYSKYRYSLDGKYVSFKVKLNGQTYQKIVELMKDAILCKFSFLGTNYKMQFSTGDYFSFEPYQVGNNTDAYPNTTYSGNGAMEVTYETTRLHKKLLGLRGVPNTPDNCITIYAPQGGEYLIGRETSNPDSGTRIYLNNGTCPYSDGRSGGYARKLLSGGTYDDFHLSLVKHIDPDPVRFGLVTAQNCGLVGLSDTTDPKTDYSESGDYDILTYGEPYMI